MRIFVMDMLVDIRDMTVTLDELITGLLDVGRDRNGSQDHAATVAQNWAHVVVLASKEPHCLQALLDATKKNDLNGQIVGVLANHTLLEPIAKAAGIPFASNSSEKNKTAHMQWLLENLKAHKPDLVVLARYMQIVSEDVVRAYTPSKIINIHPSLLPYFPGASPYRQAYENGVRVTGCTAHFVTEQLDQGPIILQDVFHINVGQDTAEDVRQRGLALEAEILTKAVRYFLDEELVVVDGKVVFKPGVSSFAKAKGGC